MAINGLISMKCFEYVFGTQHTEKTIFPFPIRNGNRNRKENCHHDYIPFNFKGNGNIVFSVKLATKESAHLFSDFQIRFFSSNVVIHIAFKY